MFFPGFKLGYEPVNEGHLATREENLSSTKGPRRGVSVGSVRKVPLYVGSNPAAA